MFLINEVEPEDFFENGKARDNISFDALKFKDRSIAFIDCNNVSVINDNFNKLEVVKQNWWELLNLQIGFKKVIKNLLLIPFPYFTGFYNNHLPSSFFKKTFESAWCNYNDILDATCICKVRKSTNVNQWLMKDLQFVNYEIKNRNVSFGKLFNINCLNIDETTSYIRKQSGKTVCINDNENTDNVDELGRKLCKAFNMILPNKSMFEI